MYIVIKLKKRVVYPKHVELFTKVELRKSA